MTFNVSDFLSRYQYIIGAIRSLKRLQAQSTDNACRITPNMTGMPSGGGTGRKVEDSAIEYADFDAEISKRLRELNKAATEILSVIESLEPSLEQLVLRFTYLNGFSFDRVVKETGKSRETVRKALKRGLELAEPACYEIWKRQNDRRK